MSLTGSGASEGSPVPLRPAMVMQIRGSYEAVSPKSTSAKVVSIAEPENISPLIPSLDGQSAKKFNAGVGRRRSARPIPTSSSRISLSSQKSMEELPPAAMPSTSQSHGDGMPRAEHRHHHYYRRGYEKLLTQVAEWLQSEKAKRTVQKAENHQGSTAVLGDSGIIIPSKPRTSSQSSDSGAMSLERLQRILEDNMTALGYEKLPTCSPNLGPRKGSQSTIVRRRASTRSLLARNASSDTEYQDGDVIVPSCDALLDNSRTLGYSRGPATPELNFLATHKRPERERKAWSNFKSEILRLAHTLRLKGWRRIPLENGGDIDVERLSGALTNAVYVVSPPKVLPPPKPTSTGIISNRTPTKLLLRIYGPQVEHLIDRENELGILRRLARKKIGPRLLGTFSNGRFEEYFVSTTLTSDDLRVPETSKQIAKRMRELHDGIDLLEQEREDGPLVWRNWDRWVERCEHVIRYLDEQILSERTGTAGAWTEYLKQRGFVCGVEWPVFKAMVEKCRKFILGCHGGMQAIKNKLVFSHNDTQYGNILRLNPTGESPLLHPANSHKQLVVIDFEYASANTPGLEFANHFTEWCYNYHDPVAPYACNEHKYPTVEEQLRFIRSYVNHRPQFIARASATPKAMPSAGPGSSISDFLLDSRSPGGNSLNIVGDYTEEEALRERQVEREVEELIRETRLWRVANSAQWVAWGIVQAKVPGLESQEQAGAGLLQSPEPMDGQIASEKGRWLDKHECGYNKRPECHTTEAVLRNDDGKDADSIENADDEDEFDYLAYTQERARFFWGDCVELGLVEEKDLPPRLSSSLKRVPY